MKALALTPRVAGLLLLPPLLWAGNAVVGRLLVGSVPPLMLNLLRWSLALALLLPLAWPAVATRRWRGRCIVQRWRPLLAIAPLGICAYNALQDLGADHVHAAERDAHRFQSRVWMLAIGALFFKEPSTRQAIVGAALSLLGEAVGWRAATWRSSRACASCPATC